MARPRGLVGRRVERHRGGVERERRLLGLAGLVHADREPGRAEHEEPRPVGAAGVGPVGAPGLAPVIGMPSRGRSFAVPSSQASPAAG